MTDPAAPDPYYQAIEEAFNRRRGAPLLLSPRDWALIGGWKSAGVPLRIVLQGIENCFDAYQRRPRTARRINSLSYCRQEVTGLHEIYLGLHGAEAGRPAGEEGAGARVPAQHRALARHLGRLQRGLKEAMASSSDAGLDPLVGAAAEAAAAIRSLRRSLKQGTCDPAVLEDALARADAALLAAARAALPDEESRRIAREVEESLGTARERMTPEALEATRRAAAARLLRLRCRLPRLSLFD
jgi:hypothetical protein